jgi:hypothetical protein
MDWYNERELENNKLFVSQAAQIKVVIRRYRQSAHICLNYIVVEIYPVINVTFWINLKAYRSI